MQPWLSRSFRPTRPLAASTCPFHAHHLYNHPQPRLGRSFWPTRSLAASALVSLLLSLLLHHCHYPVGHSGPLGLWQPPLSFFLPPLSPFSPLPEVIPAHSVLGYLPPVVLLSTPGNPFPHGHNPVGHSGPLGYWLHLGFPTTFIFTFFLPPFFLPSSSVSPTLLCFSFLHASDSVTDSPYPWIPLVSSFFSARRPVAMVIQCDLRYVATNVDPK